MSLLSVKCKLIPDASTAEKLSRTVNQFAGACNYALQVARRDNAWNKFALQRAVYKELRERFGLSANLAVRAIARVGKRKGHKAGGFKATSVDYDQRILSVNLEDEVVSLSTVDGRVKAPMHVAGYQRHLLRAAKSIQGGQLVRGRDSWYVHLWCEYDDPPAIDPQGFLGVDLGIEGVAVGHTGCAGNLVNLATDSDGEAYSVRHRHRRLRKKLQKKGSKSAKRCLKRLSGKERRFAGDLNHRISKCIVAKAQRTGRGIALEDLQGIRERVRLRKPRGPRCIAGRSTTWARSSGTKPNGPEYRWSALTPAIWCTGEARPDRGSSIPPGSALPAGIPSGPSAHAGAVSSCGLRLPWACGPLRGGQHWPPGCG